MRDENLNGLLSTFKNSLAVGESRDLRRARDTLKTLQQYLDMLDKTDALNRMNSTKLVRHLHDLAATVDAHKYQSNELKKELTYITSIIGQYPEEERPKIASAIGSVLESGRMALSVQQMIEKAASSQLLTRPPDDNKLLHVYTDSLGRQRHVHGIEMGKSGPGPDEPEILRILLMNQTERRNALKERFAKYIREQRRQPTDGQTDHANAFIKMLHDERARIRKVPRPVDIASSSSGPVNALIAAAQAQKVERELAQQRALEEAERNKGKLDKFAGRDLGALLKLTTRRGQPPPT